jgi:hypothetical protein
MPARRISWTRLGLAALLAGGALLSGGSVQGYTTSTCIGGDLYIDFYNDTTFAFQGYIRVRNATQCQ